MLKILGNGRVVHEDPTLPSSVPVPNRMEALEALEKVQLQIKHHDVKVLIDGKVVMLTTLCETLRRFILTH